MCCAFVSGLFVTVWRHLDLISPQIQNCLKRCLCPAFEQLVMHSRLLKLQCTELTRDIFSNFNAFTVTLSMFLQFCSTRYELSHFFSLFLRIYQINYTTYEYRKLSLCLIILHTLFFYYVEKSYRSSKKFACNSFVWMGVGGSTTTT